MSAPRLLEVDAVRSRRRPRAILLLWLYELASAFVIATPVHTWARHVWGAHPDGDGVIFRPRGHALLSWLGEDGPQLAIVFRTSVLAILVIAIVSQIVTGILVASLATDTTGGRAAPLRWTSGVGLSAFAPIAGIGVLVAALEGFLLGVGLLLAAGVNHTLTPSFGDQRASAIHFVVVGIFVALVLVVGVFGDLSKVAIARRCTEERVTGAPPITIAARMREAIGFALQTFRRAPGKVLGGWAWRAAIGLALIVVGGVAGDLAGGRSGLALGVLFAAHQAITITRAGLRASWVANAIRLVSGATCTPARTGAPLAPSPDPDA